MSETQQTTLTEVSIEQRKRRLMWTPDNPDRGLTEPNLYQPTVREYLKDPDSLPYEVPAQGSIRHARNQHRTWYWMAHSFVRFVCPDCDRDVTEIKGVDVHHIDENPRNGSPENLVALCRWCHRQRHGEGSTTMQPLALWRREFPAGVNNA